MNEIIHDCSSLKVSAYTNGLCGGDASHGCRTVISLGDAGGSDIGFIVDGNTIKITAAGDSELKTLYKAINFIKFALEYYEPKLKEKETKNGN